MKGFTKIDSSFYDKIETLLILKTTQSWHEYYGVLLDWKKEHPDEYVTITTAHNDLNIGKWADKIRVADRPGYKGANTKVTDEQRKKLNDENFIWEPREHAKRARLQHKKV